MAVGDAHVFPGFLTPVLTQISFQSHGLLFSPEADVRRKYTSKKKIHINWVSNSQPPGHESDMLTTKPPRSLLATGSIPLLHKYPFKRINNKQLLKTLREKKKCFLLNQKIVYPFINFFDIIFLFAAEVEESKIGM